MDSDLADYDQIDEVKSLMDNNREQIYLDGSSSQFLVTLSSSSDQASIEEVNCENDFVFLPAPMIRQGGKNNLQRQQQPESSQEQQITARSQGVSAFRADSGAGQIQLDKDLSRKSALHQIPTNPLLGINKGLDQGRNPFGNAPQAQSIDPKTKQCYDLVSPSKPVGVLNSSPAIANHKMAELMQQIVTGSDLILIAVPCNYCYEQITCSPTDISNWLNHMSKQHNCKVCPICDKLVGLGPTMDTF